MQNPSQGVAQALQPHVHLISAHRFPVSQNLNLDQAFRYLIDAPAIVKQVAPMSWHYVQAPQDGTMWLQWLHHDPNQPEKPYPSDGYIWGDPEQTFRQEYNGYTLELKIHRIGYRPGYDQMASHARTRYHFYAKNPSVAAAPPDPSLWIVHYHSSDQGQMMPAAQVPLSPQMQQALAQRRWLESQGRLERREFMLHDRDHWPSLNVPGQAAQPQYGAMAATQNRYPQQAGGPPAAKKARTSGPSVSLSGGGDSAIETSIEIEEDTALGDFFDHLTQRDISIARYSQHHRWMEEVFSSPYASNQIVPADLGLGLMGELKGLTEGILEPPSSDLIERGDKPAKPREADPFTNLKKEQVEEFGRRVEKHLEEGRAEIERMKAEHAAKMQDWKKVKTLMQAEKRLRYATWEGHEEAVPSYRLEVLPKDAPAEEIGKENVDDVVKDVEDLIKVKITSHQDATRVAKGGLKARKLPPINHDQQLNGSNAQDSVTETQPDASTTQGGRDSAGGASTASMAQTADGSSSKTSGPAFSLGEARSVAAQPMGNDINDDGLHLPDMVMNDNMMEGMDIDVADNDLNFDDATHGLVSDTPVDTPSADVPAQPTIEASTASSTTAPGPTAPSMTQSTVSMSANPTPSVGEQQPQHNQAKENASSAQGDLGREVLHGTADDVDLFNNDDKDMFSGLGDIGDGGDEALIDFDGGDMNLDDSAFGDALHGMDEPEGDGGA